MSGPKGEWNGFPTTIFEIMGVSDYSENMTEASSETLDSPNAMTNSIFESLLLNQY
jgi:hypothetical protein